MGIRAGVIGIAASVALASTLVSGPAQAREYTGYAQKYLTIACTANALRNLFVEAYNSEEYTIKELRRLARLVAAGSWKAAKKLDRIDWPADVADPIQGVLRVELSHNQNFNHLATSPTRGVMATRFDDTRWPTNTDAQLVRLRLGLPPAGAKNNGCPTR